jgi:serine/threonine protein kinase
MELCTGGSLRTRLALGPLPAELALRRGHELCATLQAVHQQGIVHGDLKPENLLFRSPLRSRQLVVDEPPYGDLLLSDFGTARRVGAPPLASAAGTRSYLSPERLHGGPPSAAADLYSLGLVTAELLSGRAASHAPAQALASDLSDVSWARLSQALGARQPPLRQLLEQLTAHEPTARPRADAALAVLKALLEP